MNDLHSFKEEDSDSYFPELADRTSWLVLQCSAFQIRHVLFFSFFFFFAKQILIFVLFYYENICGYPLEH